MAQATGSYGDVTVEIDNEYVATVEIHRPPDNYFDIVLIADLASAFEALDADPEARAAVLCSEGKHFCAGANFTTGSGDGGLGGSNRHLYDEAVRLFSTKTPAVAAIQGAAIGGGLGLALMPDFRVVVPEARLAANFAKLAFHHGFGMTVTLPAVVGQQRALELLYTGRRIGGEEAHAIGLVDRLVPLADVRAAAHAFAADIASSGPLAIESIRETHRGDLATKIRVATDREKAEQNRLQRTADFREGVKAMTERRKPDFQGH